MEHKLWREILEIVRSIAARRPARCTFTDDAIVLTYLWAVLHDRPVSWACRRGSWPIHDRRRPLPTPSTMTRRLRTASVQKLINTIEKQLREKSPTGPLHAMDGKPLPIGGNSGDPDAGFGRAAGGKAKGYKLHVFYSLSGVVRAWEVRPMQEDERTVARSLIPRAGVRGYVLADSMYEANHLFDLAQAHGLQLLTPRRYPDAKGLGHIRHSPARLRCLQMLDPARGGLGLRLLSYRPAIERFFGTLVSAAYGLPCLPPWVRRLRRVRLWVQAKLIIYAIARGGTKQAA
jgi:hypothetical protein